MNVADFLVSCLLKLHVRHVFGLPGGVVLDFLYAIDKKSDQIKAHLSATEQSAIASAYGYARASNTLGVAYGTRGPGITNMVTGVADAFYDSVPLLIITGHSDQLANNNLRVLSDQEIDVVSIFNKITKYACRIDSVDELLPSLSKAITEAFNGRKGPVLLDINRHVLSSRFDHVDLNFSEYTNDYSYKLINNIKKTLTIEISKSQRPLFVIGDGLRGIESSQDLIEIAEKNHIPMISSRFSQDLVSHSKYFFGYFGSHGTRYANFILSKADLIISFGNRMLFQNNQSKTFLQVFNQTKVIRFDVDESELSRGLPDAVDFCINLDFIIPQIKDLKFTFKGSHSWFKTATSIKTRLNNLDTDYPVSYIAQILKAINNDHLIVSDVGNNEYWLSRASAFVHTQQMTLYSKSFGAMGSSISKAIGAYYAKSKPVWCFIGDQSLQMVIQDLHLISKHNLPIKIILLNNHSSGMIRSRQKVRHNEYYLQTTENSGYSVPNFIEIAKAYNLRAVQINPNQLRDFDQIFINDIKPILVEIIIDHQIEMIPYVQIGDPIQKMEPQIDHELYRELDQL